MQLKGNQKAVVKSFRYDVDSLEDFIAEAGEGVRLFVCGGLVYK